MTTFNFGIEKGSSVPDAWPFSISDDEPSSVSNARSSSVPDAWLFSISNARSSSVSNARSSSVPDRLDELPLSVSGELASRVSGELASRVSDELSDRSSGYLDQNNYKKAWKTARKLYNLAIKHGNPDTYTNAFNLNALLYEKYSNQFPHSKLFKLNKRLCKLKPKILKELDLEDIDLIINDNPYWDFY